MLKKLMAAVLSVVVLGAIAPVRAADMDGVNGVGAQLGFASPGGDLGDASDGGVTYGVHYFRGLQNNFGILAALDMFSFAKKTGGADFTNNALSVNGVYMFPAENLPVMPFAFLGLSYNMTNIDAGGGVDKDTNGIGFNIGIGANKQINDQWIAGLTLAYKTFPDVDLPAGAGGGTATGNATVIGIHVGYKLGS